MSNSQGERSVNDRTIRSNGIINDNSQRETFLLAIVLKIITLSNMNHTVITIIMIGKETLIFIVVH